MKTEIKYIGDESLICACVARIVKEFFFIYTPRNHPLVLHNKEIQFSSIFNVFCIKKNIFFRIVFSSKFLIFLVFKN